MSFKPFSRNNPCPVCAQAHSDCRYHTKDPDFIQCHTFVDAAKGEKINGFVCVKASNGHTASFKPDNSQEWTDERRQEWATEQKRRREQAQAEERRKRDQLLPIPERDKQYRRIISTLGLNQKHSTELSSRRGLNPDEIDFAINQQWLCSWKPGVKVNASSSLAGVAGSQIAGVVGLGIAAVNPTREITGFQIASDNRVKYGKYIWLSSASKGGLGPHLPSGELPVFVWRHPQADKITETWLVEGGLKSLITALKLWFRCGRKDIQVIGAAGGNWQGSINAVLEALNQVKKVVLCPDAGSVNNAHILANYKRIIEELTNRTYSVSVAWWGQVTKEQDDIDELPIEKHEHIEYICVERFLALCRKYGDINPHAQPEFKDYNDQVIAVQKQLHTLSYAADIECNPYEKYLPSLKDRIPQRGIVLLKAAKGSGKSYQIKQIKQQWIGGYWSEKIIDEPQQLDILGNPQPPKVERIWHEKTGKKFVSINARIALGREQAIRWEFTWIEDTDFEKSLEFNAGGEIVQTATVLETIDEIGLCWDSLAKLFDRDWSNTLVVIDELELGLAHVSTSSTCRDRRSQILHTLELKLKECLNNGGLVIGADADLTDISYEYLTSLAPGNIPFIVCHDYQRPDDDKWTITFHSGKKDEILAQIIDHLADENCEPIAVATDNQSEAEALHNVLCKKYPYLKKEIGGAIRIDSKITQTDFGKNFVKRPNQSTEKYQPKILIYTPSLGVGCSIEVDYYKTVFGLFFGNLEPSQARQMLGRVRLPVDRIVWCKSRASSAENDHTSFLPDVIKKQMFAYNDTTHELIETALYLAKEQAKGIDNDAELLPHLIQVLQGMMGENGTWNNPHIDLVCKQKARRNYALSQLALQLRQELIEEGHNLIDWSAITQTSAGDNIRDEKDEIKQHKALMVANAPDITLESAVQIDRKIQKTLEEEYQSTKAHLTEELPEIELTPDFVYKAVFKDGRRWLNQVKLFWMVTNPEATVEADRKHWKYKLKQFSSGVACLHDVRTFSPKVEAIHKSGLLEIVKPDDFTSVYHDQDQGLAQWFNELLKRNRKTKFIKTAFGISITKDTQIIKFINKLLGKIGLKLKKSRQGTDGTNYYKLDSQSAQDPDRIAVLEALKRKYEQQQIDQLTREQEAIRQTEAEAIALQQLPEIEVKSGLDMVNSPQSTVHSSQSVDPIQSWLTDESMECLAAYLEACSSPEMLSQLREIAPATALKLAARRLPPAKKQMIKRWVTAA
ncbi:MAG TPA: plasmid replication protein, CyRepA1 family [Leptolyngbyaceae cyanobacterium]